ncbi:MAG: heme biosynthesis HemY N-terminal domain-containing protein [Burkholderiaceae bacterium]
MRGVIWLVLLFATAVVAALTLGSNDGLVSFFHGHTRLDLSLNLFLIAGLVAAFALVFLLQGIDSLITLPARAKAWRALQRERAMHAALREAMAEHFAGRFNRAHKAAQRALAVQASTDELAGDRETRVLAHLLAARSLHRLQDHARRDHLLLQALQAERRAMSPKAVDESARLLGAEWALDDGDAVRAGNLLAELAPGAARRTQALRLKLRVARMNRHPAEALATARLLAKHQAFTPEAAEGLLRSLAIQMLEEARDADQLRRAWAALDDADRDDAFVAARAARCAIGFGASDDARAWLRPLWDRLRELSAEQRAQVSLALAAAAEGMGADWVPALEAAQQAWPHEAAVQAAVGTAFATRGLMGKARRPLEIAAADKGLETTARRRAWRLLAALASGEGDDERARRCEQAAAAVD